MSGLDRASVFCGRFVIGVYIFIVAVGMLMGFSVGLGRVAAGIFGLAAAAVCLRFLPGLCRRAEGCSALRLWAVLTLLCIAVKTAWILLAQVEPAGDFRTFMLYAEGLAANDVLKNGRYVALFPHILGYAEFLSLFMRVFGSHPMLAPAINVALTVLSGSLLYLLARRLMGLGAAALSYALWILCPSQTIYNSLVLSEPLYTMGILALLLLVTELSTRMEGCATVNPVACAGLGAAAGLLLAGINATRPLGIILLLTLLLWLVCLRTHVLLVREKRRAWLCFAAAMLVVYVLSGQCWESHLEKRVGEAPAGVPGYSLLVGFNAESAGRWNEEDASVFDEITPDTERTAEDIQRTFFDMALERIHDGGINYPVHFAKKLGTLLGMDNAAVGYAASTLGSTLAYSAVCNSFYYAILALSFVGAVRLRREKSTSPLMLWPVYFLGLSLGHLLVEVAGRYHYSLIPALILLAAFAVTGGRAENALTEPVCGL